MRKFATLLCPLCFFTLAPVAAYADTCESAHSQQIVNCNGNQGCMARADAAYLECLMRENVPQD